MTEPNVPAGLREWALLPGPQRVLAAIRRRAYRGAQLDKGTLRVQLAPDERQQVARLLGTPWEVTGHGVTLSALGIALAEHQLTVRRFVEQLDGTPLPVHSDELAADQQRSDAEKSEVVAILRKAGIDSTTCESWMTRPGAPRPGTGRAAELATRIAEVWPLLPWTGPRKRLGQLAAETTGDAHALDYSSDLGRAIARLIASATGQLRPNRPGRAWRAAWAAAGIQCDTVSSRVLTLNLPLDIVATRRGAPVWLTLRDLLAPWTFDHLPQRLFVCENPTIVEAAADALGPHCPPLVCTDGMPALAALDLITGAAELGIDIHARADIDRAGLTIVSTVRIAARATQPWRFDVPTYTTHFGIDIPGDATLAQAWEQYGQDLHEEAILPALLADLREEAASQHQVSR